MDLRICIPLYMEWEVPDCILHWYAAKFQWAFHWILWKSWIRMHAYLDSCIRVMDETLLVLEAKNKPFCFFHECNNKLEVQIATTTLDSDGAGLEPLVVWEHWDSFALSPRTDYVEDCKSVQVSLAWSWGLVDLDLIAELNVRASCVEFINTGASSSKAFPFRCCAAYRYTRSEFNIRRPDLQSIDSELWGSTTLISQY